MGVPAEIGQHPQGSYTVGYGKKRCNRSAKNIRARKSPLTRVNGARDAAASVKNSDILGLL